MKLSGSFFIGISILFLAAGCQLIPGPVKPESTRPPAPTKADLKQAEPSTYRIFLIALEDSGRSGPAVGCGDSLVSVDIPATDVKTALQSLLETHDRLYGQSGLYNALYQSDLRVNRIIRDNDTISADLSGQLVLGGTCDAPRVKAQLEATLRQSTESRIPVTIRINRDPLEDLLSGR